MEELFRLVSDAVAEVIRARLSVGNLFELRIRNNAPIRVGYGGGYFYLCENGITKDKSAAIVASGSEADNIVMRACERSLYTVTETLKSGYISVRGGIRVGVCWGAVCNGGVISAVKDFSSVNIRIPHEVLGCAASIVGKICNSDGIKSTVILSKPGGGKTTVLRDLCRLISDRGHNVLLCDEKYELASMYKGVPSLDVGCCTDVMSGADKPSVFRAGIAYMRPEVIMTDELFEEDIEAVTRAVHCGIAVIATAHAKDVTDFTMRLGAAVPTKVFEQFAVISETTRTISIYNADGEVVV